LQRTQITDTQKETLVLCVNNGMSTKSKLHKHLHLDAAERTGLDAAERTGLDAAERTGLDAAERTGLDAAERTGLDVAVVKV